MCARQHTEQIRVPPLSASTVPRPAVRWEDDGVRSGRVGRVGWAAIGLAAVVELTTVVLSWGVEPAYDTLGYAVASLAMVGAGTLILARQPENRIGWLFLAIGLLDPVTGELAQAWGVRASLNGWPGGSIGEVIGTATWPLGGIGWILVFLLFPDGRLVSPGWRIVPWIGAIGAVVALAGWVPSPDRGEEFVQGTNPLAAPDLPTGTLFAVGGLLFGAALLASAASLVVRFRRSTGVLRQQLKWFAYAGAFAGTILPVTVALWTVWPPVHVLVPVAILSLPVGAYVAIARHRLYDIDLLINQTAVYAVVDGTDRCRLRGDRGDARDEARPGVAVDHRRRNPRRRGRVPAQCATRCRMRSTVVSDVRATTQLGGWRTSTRRYGLETLHPEDVQQVLAEVLDDPALEILYAEPGRRRLPRQRRQTDGARFHRSAPGGRRTRRTAVRHRDASDVGRGRGGRARHGGRGRRPGDRDLHASASSCAASWPRSMRHGNGSSRRVTRSGVVSNATCTTAPSSG